MAYEAPTVVRYGTVTGLTSSALKCSPGADDLVGKGYTETGDPLFWQENVSSDVIGGFESTYVKGTEPAACISGSAFIDLHS